MTHKITMQGSHMLVPGLVIPTVYKCFGFAGCGPTALSRSRIHLKFSKYYLLTSMADDVQSVFGTAIDKTAIDKTTIDKTAIDKTAIDKQPSIKQPLIKQPSIKLLWIKQPSIKHPSTKLLSRKLLLIKQRSCLLVDAVA